MTDLQALATEAGAWRRELHQMPEILFDLERTADFVAEKLEAFGCETHRGIAKTGIVAVIEGDGSPGPTILLRADMDALPMEERTNLPHASKHPGRMHACGHDGHTAMLLAAARRLAAERAHSGRVVLCFQPAEEGGHGARVMIEEGLLDRFSIDEVYAIHNQPGLPVGAFASRPGPMLAAGDRFVITLRGRGGHAAAPHLANDPMLAQAQLVTALQSIASRRTDPMDQAVASVTWVAAGSLEALNVIPAEVRLGGSIRALKPDTRRQNEQHLRDIVAGVAATFNMEAELDWRPGYPVTVNDPAATEAALAVARAIGTGTVNGDCAPEMGSEDFSYMLQRRPGALLWIGNGDSAELHSPSYDFNDSAILPGIRFWLELIHQRLPGRGMLL